MPHLFLRGVAIGSVSGVLFDKDGTLSNSENHLRDLAKFRIQKSIELCQNTEKYRCINIAKLKDLLCSAYGITSKGLNPNGSIAIASREHNLISTATVFTQLLGNWPQSFQAAKQIFNEVDYLQSKGLNKISERTILPGAIRVLEDLTAHGVVCCLISNDNSDGIETFLKINNLQENIKKIWSSDHHPPKPNPKSVTELCESIELTPSQCALIGDADSDLMMAQQAGIGLVLGYTAGWSNPPSLHEYQHLIHHWDELVIQ